MSRQKWTLTHAEQHEYRKRVERLRTAGADLDASSFESAHRDWIKITHDRFGYVRALPTGSLFLIPARIVALAPKVIFQGFELSSPAMELGAWFLEDPTVNCSDSRLYRFRDGTDFRRNEVLNHRVDAEGTLRYGDVMEGMLLAESFDAIPAGFVDRRLIPICLSIINQFGDGHESTIELRVERTAGRIQLLPPRRSGLFEREDGLPGDPALAVDIPDAVSLRLEKPSIRHWLVRTMKLRVLAARQLSLSLAWSSMNEPQKEKPSAGRITAEHQRNRSLKPAPPRIMLKCLTAYARYGPHFEDVCAHRTNHRGSS